VVGNWDLDAFGFDTKISRNKGEYAYSQGLEQAVVDSIANDLIKEFDDYLYFLPSIDIDSEGICTGYEFGRIYSDSKFNFPCQIQGDQLQIGVSEVPIVMTFEVSRTHLKLRWLTSDFWGMFDLTENDRQTIEWLFKGITHLDYYFVRVTTTE